MKGHALTVTDPTPPSAPVPPAALLAQLASLVREIAASADRDISEAVAWMHKNKV
jgi:hypothetical protein